MKVARSDYTERRRGLYLLSTPIKVFSNVLYINFNLRARVDLNHRPTEPESVALSPEPRAQT